MGFSFSFSFSVGAEIATARARPDRWIALPKAASELQGLYAHTLTFLDGHRACIGYKFALSECVFVLYPLSRCVGLRLILVGCFGLWQDQGVFVCAAARPRVLDRQGRRDRETRQVRIFL